MLTCKTTRRAQGSKTYLPQIEDVTMEEKIPGKLSEEVEDLVDEGSVSSENLNTIDVQGEDLLL